MFVFIIIVLIMITFVVASARLSLRLSSMCGDHFSSNSMCRESSKTKEQRRFSACYTRRQAQPCLNLLTLTPCRARRVADGRESTVGTPRCALSGPTKRPLDRTLAGTAGIKTPRTLACTGSLNVPLRVLAMNCWTISTMRKRLFPAQSVSSSMFSCEQNLHGFVSMDLTDEQTHLRDWASSLSASSVNSDSLLRTLSMSCRKLGSSSSLGLVLESDDEGDDDDDDELLRRSSACSCCLQQ